MIKSRLKVLSPKEYENHFLKIYFKLEFWVKEYYHVILLQG